MTKYRGSNSGIERGEYRTALLVTDRLSERMPEGVSWRGEIEEYFHQAGKMVEHNVEPRFQIGDTWKGFVAHYAGATVIGKFYFPPYDGIVLELASNDDLEDVKRQINKRFPFLKEAEDDSDVTSFLGRESDNG